VEIKLEMDSAHYLFREAMTARILLRNDGATAIEVPDPEDNRNTQPVYTVTGPSYPKGHAFHFHAAAQEEGAPIPGTGGAKLTLGAGETHEATLPLAEFVKFSRPGAHTLTVSLAVAGRTVTSAPVPFTVEPAVFKAMSIAADDGQQTSRPIRVVCLVGNGERNLYNAVFAEQDRDSGVVTLDALVRVGAAEPRATVAVAAWANHDRLGLMHDRFGWRSGATLGIESVGDAGSHPRLALPDATMTLVRPALLAESGALDVPALGGAGGTTLFLSRFPVASPAGAGGEPKLAWTLPLAAAPSAARAAIAPRTAHETRAVLLVGPPVPPSSSSPAAQLTLVQWTPDAARPSVRSLTVPGALPAPGAEPALRFEADGTARGSALFIDGEDPQHRSLLLVDATWPPGAMEGRLSARQSVVRLAAPLRAAAVTYSVAPPSPGRRDWLVLLTDGTAIFSGSPGEHRQLGAAPSLPLQLVGMSRTTYVLAVDKQGFPQLVPLH
jgi:hypothetical protein